MSSPYEYDQSGHYLAPHRGTLILVLGILSLVVCGPLGIAAWVMGSNDLAEMRDGRMDRSGEGTTRAGQICGMVACGLMVLGTCFFGLAMALSVGIGR